MEKYGLYVSIEYTRGMLVRGKLLFRDYIIPTSRDYIKPTRVRFVGVRHVKCEYHVAQRCGQLGALVLSPYENLKFLGKSY